RARAPLERPEGSSRRRRAHHAQLRAPGRRRAALEAPDGHGRDPVDRRSPWARRGERVPRRRRERPSDELLRRAGPRGVRARARGERGDPPRLHRARRDGHRRARRRHGQGRETGDALQPGRPRGDARGPPGLRSSRTDEPPEGVPIGAACVRRAVGRGGSTRPGGHVGLGPMDERPAPETAVAPRALLSGAAPPAHAVGGHAPRFGAEPTPVDGGSRVLALASDRGLAVVPTGHGARLGWGAPPRRLDIVLSLARLDRVLAHEPEDLTLSVECGARLDALDAILRPYRQFIPLDPARSEASTIGGLIATGAAGPYRARYGTMRDLLVGLTVVRASGIVVKGGGRVVKNVTGYDIPKLHVGALGTL